MKTTPLLLILLLGSLGYNFYQYTTYKTASLTSDTGYCIKTDPFDAAIVIENEAAKGYYEEFTHSLTDSDSTTGGVISRAAFDELFCLEKCNGVTYSFARDKSGTTGPGGNGIFIIFQGVHVAYDSTEKTILSVNPIDGAKKYRSGNWCPVSCMAF